MPSPIGSEDCAYLKDDFSTRGRLKALSPFPVADSSETFPWVGNKIQTKNLKRTHGEVATTAERHTANNHSFFSRLP
jgi:hypothetical protein